MLINEEEIKKRLNNPLNLINRMKEGLIPPVKKNAMDLFVKREGVVSVVEVKGRVETEKETPTSDDIIDDIDSKVKLATAHDRALDLLNCSLEKLHSKVENDEVKASSIPSIVASASKVITDIRKERVEREKNKGNENIHYHVYCPVQKSISDYEIIDVKDEGSLMSASQ